MTSKPAVTSRKVHASLLVILLLAFFTIYNREYFSDEINPDKNLVLFNQHKSGYAITWNTKQVDSATAFAAEGDLVARTGNDDISDIFRRFNTHDATYSHIGIIFYDNGYPFVYNITAESDNPAGMITRDSLSHYISPESNLGFGIYRLALNKLQKKQLHAEAIRYLKEKRKFDLYFDLRTDTLLYCTEFIYKLVGDVIHDVNYFPLTHNEDMNFDYITVDNILSQKKIRMMCKVRYKQ